MDNTKKVALITGGAKRIGAAIGRKLHAEGFTLVIHYHQSKSTAESLASELQQKRPNSVSLVQGDLRDPTTPRNLVKHCHQAHGQLDLLVNNASAFFPTPINSASITDWELLMDINLKAPFFLSQAATPLLAKQQGCIINLLDIYAERPLADHPIYTATKAGLAALTRSLARDLAPDIRVNGVAPGAILWPEAGQDEASRKSLIARTPLKRLGQTEDIANTIYFLATAPFITGQVVNVDGGRTILP